MKTCSGVVAGLIVAVMMVAICPQPVVAATAAEINRDANKALKKLFASAPKAKELAANARGILVFPKIFKGGFVVGGQYGEGALRIGGKTAGYYSSAATSYGLQAGAQTFGYALFFMTESALDYFKKSEGWEIGSGPSVVIVDEGMASSLTTTTAKHDVYAFFFSQKGLMAGLGLQGTKISKIKK